MFTYTFLTFCSHYLPGIISLVVVDIILRSVIRRIAGLDEQGTFLGFKKEFRSFIPILISIIIFVTGSVIAYYLVMGCMDGTFSPSIGRPGACSHHGGVRITNIEVVFEVVYALSIICSTLAEGWLIRKEEEKWRL